MVSSAPSAMVTLARLSHRKNARKGSTTTDRPMDAETRWSQEANALPPSSFTLSGTAICTRPDPAKAESPTSVSVAGSATDSSDVHLPNAEVPIVIRPALSDTVFNAVQP